MHTCFSSKVSWPRIRISACIIVALTMWCGQVLAANNLATTAAAWTILRPEMVNITPQGMAIQAATPGDHHPVAMLTAPFGDETRFDFRVDSPAGFTFGIWQATGLNPFHDHQDRLGDACVSTETSTSLRLIGTDAAMKLTRWDPQPYREFATPWQPTGNRLSFIRYQGMAKFLINGASTSLPVAGWENTLWLDNHASLTLLLFAVPAPVMLHELTLTPLHAAAALDAQNAIPIRFTLPAPRYVTLAINDASGNRVRNLMAGTPFTAGPQVVYWDGRDDFGRQAPAGTYTAVGLHRDAIHLVYRFSLNNSGQPSWLTADHTGGWLADHSPPMAVLALGDRVFLGSPGPEANDGLIMTDLDGRKRWAWGYNVMDNNPTLFASDGHYLYCISDQGESKLYRFDIRAPCRKRPPSRINRAWYPSLNSTLAPGLRTPMD